jgi:cell division protein FtsL
MFMALRAVMNDRNHTLVKIDKVVYTTATVAMAVMVVYFLAWGSKTLMLLNIF